MDDENGKTIWSYSRLKTFEDCKYRYYLRYVDRCKEQDMFYTTYGLFMHHILELRELGMLSKEEMLTEFVDGFADNVRGFQAEKIKKKYFDSGIDYLLNYEDFELDDMEVEKKYFFDIKSGIKFVGILDCVGTKDGKLYLIDHKSRDLKPRSKRKKPTLKDLELDSMLKQLYLYSVPLKEKYGRFPDYLCFNCFRTQTFIKEPFVEERFNETIEWAADMVACIQKEEEYEPDIEYFSCKNICGVSNDCIYKEMAF